MTDIIFVRHGYSEGNLREEFHGHFDGDLTELGHKQADITGEYLKEREIAAVISSDLRRAMKTAKHIADLHGLPVIPDSRLREIYAGKWEGEKFSALSEKYPKLYDIWFNDPAHFISPDGESMTELFDRVCCAVSDIAERYDGKTVVIVSHATPLRALNCTWLGGGLELFGGIDWVKNASISEIEYGSDGRIEPIVIDLYSQLADNATGLSTEI